MPVITGVEESPRRRGRYEVFVDGAATATVSAESIARLDLGPGKVLDDAMCSALAEESAVIEAVDRALDLLAFRDRTAAELRRRLVQKGVEGRHATSAVDRLVEQGIVNDGQVARSLARAKALGAGLSRRRIEQELARKGVARDVAADAVEEVWREEAVDQVEIATRLARKRLASLQDLELAARRRRLYAFLARRGYSPQEIRVALDRVLGESDRGESADGEGTGWWGRA